MIEDVNWLLMMVFGNVTLAPFYKADRGVQVLSTRPECMPRTSVIPFSKPVFDHKLDSGEIKSGGALRSGNPNPRLVD